MQIDLPADHFGNHGKGFGSTIPAKVKTTKSAFETLEPAFQGMLAEYNVCTK